jgi:hypothetical protein
MRERVLAALEGAIHRAGGGFPPSRNALPLASLEVLALELSAWQRERCEALEALAAGARPRSLEEIPAVPVDLFKQIPLATFPLPEARAVFRTSGTTQGTRGAVYLRDTRVYDLGACAWARACVPELPRRTVSLCSHAEDSSLGHMVERLAEGGLVRCFDAARGLAPDAWDQLRAAAAEGPVFLACTAFALDALLARPGGVALDAASVVMVTGGFKGREARLDAPSLYRALPERLGAPRVVGEYGMTELSSQLWTEPVPAGSLPGAFRAPPWLYVYAVDPATGRPAAGEGQLRFVDLCNVDSPVAVETLDLGSVESLAGDQRVTLRGRLEGSEARGCSLTAEAFLGTRAE